MARKVRIEYPGAFFHVINRGNFRSWIFETGGARRSFCECLTMGCEAQGWRLHAWCLMGNHYHLLIETPQPNLVDGMKWVQSDLCQPVQSLPQDQWPRLSGPLQGNLAGGGSSRSGLPLHSLESGQSGTDRDRAIAGLSVQQFPPALESAPTVEYCAVWRLPAKLRRFCGQSRRSPRVSGFSQDIFGRSGRAEGNGV